MRKFTILLAGAAAATAIPAAAQVQEPANTFVRIGVGKLALADEGPIAMDGTVVPGGDYRTPNPWLVNLEVGSFVAGKFAVQVSGTSPVETANVPAGSLEGLPSLGSDTFSVFTLTGTFHPLRGKTVSPYVGAGIGLQHVWSTKDGIASNLEVEDTVGPVLQAGVEIAVGKRLGLFLDVKKGFWKTDASADLGPSRITARPELDPIIFQLGGLIRF